MIGLILTPPVQLKGWLPSKHILEITSIVLMLAGTALGVLTAIIAN